MGIARVNGREYYAEEMAESPEVAMELAAGQAYMLCRCVATSDAYR